VERRSGKDVGAGTALRQISLATGGTLTLKCVPANHVVLVRLTLDQFIFWPKLPQTRDLASKISTPPAPTPSTATRSARGRKLPRCWDLGLGNRSPKSKFTTTPLLMSVTVCPFVCLSACLPQEPQSLYFTKCFCACCQWPRLSPSGITVRYVLPFL